MIDPTTLTWSQANSFGIQKGSDGTNIVLHRIMSNALGQYIYFYTSQQVDTLTERLFLGKYPSLSALESAHPTAEAGQYAQVDEGVGFEVINYNWDDEEGWVEGSSGSGATDTDMLPEGNDNLYFTEARVLATLLAGLNNSLTGDITSSDTILQAFGRLQNSITRKANLNGGNEFNGNQILNDALYLLTEASVTPYLTTVGADGLVMNGYEVQDMQILDVDVIADLENETGWSENIKAISSGEGIFAGQFYLSETTEYFYFSFQDGQALRIYYGLMLVEDSTTMTAPNNTFMNTNYGNKPIGFRVYFSGGGMTRLVIKVSTGWIFNDMSALT